MIHLLFVARHRRGNSMENWSSYAMMWYPRSISKCSFIPSRSCLACALAHSIQLVFFWVPETDCNWRRWVSQWVYCWIPPQWSGIYRGLFYPDRRLNRISFQKMSGLLVLAPEQDSSRRLLFHSLLVADIPCKTSDVDGFMVGIL